MGSTDEGLIYKEMEAFVEVWNKGDAKAAAYFFTEDGTRIGAFGDKRHGRADIEMAFGDMLNRTMQVAKVKQEKGSIRMLSPDLAVWQGDIEMTLPNGVSMKGYAVQIMKKVSGRWLQLEAHPKFYPPPPV